MAEEDSSRCTSEAEEPEKLAERERMDTSSAADTAAKHHTTSSLPPPVPTTFSTGDSQLSRPPPAPPPSSIFPDDHVSVSLHTPSPAPRTLSNLPQRPTFISLPSSSTVPLTTATLTSDSAELVSPSTSNTTTESLDESTTSGVTFGTASRSRFFPNRSVKYPTSSSAGGGAHASHLRGGGAGAGGGSGGGGTSSTFGAVSPSGFGSSSSRIGGASASADAGGAGGGAGSPQPQPLSRDLLQQAARGLGSQQQPRGPEDEASSTGADVVRTSPTDEQHGRTDDSGTSTGELRPARREGRTEHDTLSLVQETGAAEEDAAARGGRGAGEGSGRGRAGEGQAEMYEARRTKGNIVEGEDRDLRSSIMSGSTEKPLILTTRFEHEVTDSGESLVLTGREGHLERCEDEPIHAPGAIQSFGVLIAFDVEEDGRWFVQQVSENSGFILGLPPRYLFRLRDFLEILEPDEVDALEDALDALDDRDQHSSSNEVGPYTFTLSGQGIPGSGNGSEAQAISPFAWSCHSAIHRPCRSTNLKRVILELELIEDMFNPLSTESHEPFAADERVGQGRTADNGEGAMNPSEEELMESTASIVRPLRTLSKISKKRQRKGRKPKTTLGEYDAFSLIDSIDDQMSKAENLATFLKITAGVFRELTEFDRVMVYQFDDQWNGRVVAEQVDYTRSKDLFRGLSFPAADIPRQARELYKINKVRLLYDLDACTARLCCRSVDEVNAPLNMTHSHLRAMSPIHIKYLGNMGVRSSMSVSITAFGDLWGLVSMHGYGRFGHRVSFPVRQLCKLLGQSISRNIERLSMQTRIQARKLINTASTSANPSGFIVAKAEDLLKLFAADCGVLSVGDEAKILGSVENSAELLCALEFLRTQKFTSIQYSQSITQDYKIDFPDGFNQIAGLLCVPLAPGGEDFIVFFRKGQLQNISWAGNPYANKTSKDVQQALEPRKSFAVWSEQVVGRSLVWTDEEKETAGILYLVYGKFIAVWREKESAIAASNLTSILLRNASHEVRTPLNAIINYLELALDTPLQADVREHLQHSHDASKTLLHSINDLLDLTRTEKGQPLFLTEPFNIVETINYAVAVHREEAERLSLSVNIIETPSGTPPILVGDRAKVRSCVSNLCANAVKHCKEGGVLIEWGEVPDQDVADALEEKANSIRIGISISDTGVGMSNEQLEGLFRDFEQVTRMGDDIEKAVPTTGNSVGLGLAVVARIVRTMGGQLQVESTVDKGSKFTIILPFLLPPPPSPSQGTESVDGSTSRTVSELASREPSAPRSGSASGSSSGRSNLNDLINAMATSGAGTGDGRMQSRRQLRDETASATSANKSQPSTDSLSSVPSRLAAGHTKRASPPPRAGEHSVKDSKQPIRAVRVGDNTVSPIHSLPLFDRSSSAGPKSPPLPVDGTSMEARARSSSAAAATDLPPTATATPSAPVDLTPSPPLAPSDVASQLNTNRKLPDVDSDDYIKPMRVLVVEDELVNRMIISKRLQIDGHEVVVAEHGAIAVRKFEEDRNFDIILMDLQMPIMGGLEASTAIRNVEKTSPLPLAEQRPSTVLNRSVPIIAVTASLPERDRHTIVEAGLSGWVLKPVDFKRLRVLMKGALDPKLRKLEVYRPGAYEQGGWNVAAPKTKTSSKPAQLPSNPSSADHELAAKLGVLSLHAAATD